MKKAAFFDRDGTLIKDVHFLSDIKQIQILPGVIEFCLKLQNEGYELFVITNQSGVARGYFDEAFVQRTHIALKDLFAQHGVLLADFYYCPHLKDCTCRKPQPGLFLSAAREHDLDLKNSLAFGDKERDLQAGVAVGCKSFYIQDALRDFELIRKGEYGRRTNRFR